MSAAPLAFEVVLAAAPARVFALLTSGSGLTRWFCDAADSEERMGGALRLRWTRATSSPEPFVARWTEFAPPAGAAFRGGHSGYPGGDAGTVRFALAAEAAGTRLRVEHTLPAGGAHDAFAEPWRAAWTRALERLARVALEPAH